MDLADQLAALLIEKYAQLRQLDKDIDSTTTLLELARARAARRAAFQFQNDVTQDNDMDDRRRKVPKKPCPSAREEAAECQRLYGKEYTDWIKFKRQEYLRLSRLKEAQRLSTAERKMLDELEPVVKRLVIKTHPDRAARDHSMYTHCKDFLTKCNTDLKFA